MARRRRRDYYTIYMRSLAWLCGIAIASCWTLGMMFIIKTSYHF